VHVPRLYAENAGLPLALVGLLLLAARFADALADPLLGLWSDRVGNRRRLILLALPPLGLGLAALLAPPDTAGAGWLLATLALTFSRLQPGHHQLPRLGRRARRHAATQPARHRLA
jgi:GPH family glycoside/pentoside/hexuronide:cation symporter